jgi:hypothetical protein
MLLTGIDVSRSIGVFAVTVDDRFVVKPCVVVQ